MKKNILIKLVAILFCFFVVVNIDIVDAKECSTKELNSLKQLAHNIKFSYELADDTYNVEHSYYFHVFMTNLSDKFYIRAYNSVENEDTGNNTGAFYWLKEGKTYPFYVYASSITNCKDTLLVTKKLQLPYYNDYSQKEECIGYEEFDLCQPYYGGVITSEEYFYEKLENYKESLKEEPEVEGEKSVFQTIINFYITNWMITVPVTLLVLGMIIFVFIRTTKNRKKVKIRI